MFRYFLSFLFLALVSAGTNQEGLDFLAKMKKEDGVIETPSGLLYKVMTDACCMIIICIYIDPLTKDILHTHINLPLFSF